MEQLLWEKMMKDCRLVHCFIRMTFFVIVAHTYLSGDFQNIPYKKITILTAPIGGSGNAQYAVVRSLMAGFNRLGVNFNHNPARVEDVGDVVIALSDVNALRQAISLKKQGHIKKLLAGPMLMVRADEYNHIAASREIDTYLINSEWTKIAYQEEEPLLIGRLGMWYVGVDTVYWAPEVNNAVNNKQVLVYWKTESENFCCSIELLLKKYGWDPIRIKYGNYSPANFKNILSGCRFAVFISRSESQGIALAETWAMDVPTIVWNPKKLVAHGREYSVVSACPYLTQYTGIDWQELSQFESILQSMDERIEVFSPREWVLNNMTDEISARVLLRIIDGALQ